MTDRICIITLALPIETDPRSGRQIDTLAREYDVTVIGFGVPPDSVTWKAVDRTTPRWRRALEMGLLAIGRIFPAAYDLYYRTRPRYREALAHALATPAQVYHASDWAVLPIVVQAARVHRAHTVYDIDEYWARFEESSPLWRLFFGPLIRHIEKRYAPQIDRAMSVSPVFTERYRAEHGLDSIVVYNAPPYREAVPRPTDARRIRLIHHGSLLPDRHLETLIEMMPLLPDRFTLDMLLGGSNPAYLEALRALADRLAPGRVTFRPPVTYDRVVESIADCDIELCYMAPTTFTWLNTLPNKLFEALQARLAVLVGPSPAMAAVVRETGAGWVAAGFAPADLANALRGLTAADIDTARAHADAAARMIHAESEADKLRTLYREIIPSP